jgi:hypothetical protein
MSAVSTTGTSGDLAIDKIHHLTDKPGSFDPWLLQLYAKLATLGAADHIIGIDTTQTRNFTIYDANTKGKYDPSVHARNMAESSDTGHADRAYMVNYKTWTKQNFPPRAWDADKNAHIGPPSPLIKPTTSKHLRY